MEGIIRQGDILLIPVGNTFPKGKAVRQVVLAEGEATGHCHTLSAPEVYDWSVGEQRYVRVSGGTGLIAHPDHDPIAAPVLEPDQTYQVLRQHEWNLKGEWRKVKD